MTPALHIALPFLILLFACQNETKTPIENEVSEREILINRALEHELNTTYEPPPGDALSHHASGFAKVMCSGIFITGLEAEFVAENIGYFSAPYEERSKFDRWSVDDGEKSVSVHLPNGIVRKAILTDGQGCVCLTEGTDMLSFVPRQISSNLADPASLDWPMGDRLSSEPFSTDIDMDLVAEAVDAAFATEEGMTAALVITHRGRIIGERYRNGITKDTPLESWSMGKSLTATFMGVLIEQGVYKLEQPAPIPEWQKENDPRAEIKIADILRMSSGLRFRAPQDPDFDPALGYPDHLYVYTGGINSFHYAATRPQQWKPNTIGRYRNSDPVLTNYLVRLGVEGRGGDYHSFPQRELFDKIGVRNMVMETDPYGNFLLQGYEFAPARDWARLGNLYLQDGVWNGERILAEGFVDFASTLAPAWVADGREIYGGFFWINGEEQFPIPKDAYFMAGAGGQLTFIIPSHDLVVVKMSHYKGSAESGADLSEAFKILMKAVPPSV